MKQKEAIEFNGEMLIVAVEPAKKDLIDRILEKENGIKIECLAWQSKYNSYVVYDYEPFCAEGFIVNYQILGDMNKLKFLKAIIDKAINQRSFLEKCLQKQSAKAIA